MTPPDSTIDIARPHIDEYDPYYETYVGKVSPGPVLATLETQLSEVRDLIARLDETRAGYRYAAGKWSVKEVLGHLLDSERVFSFRALWFSRAQAAPLPGMDPDAFGAAAGLENRPLTGLATEYSLARRSTIELFRGLSDDQLLRRGTASGCEFTTRSIAFIIAGHERHHLAVLAERYDLR